jgi:ATP-dependent RNA helicase DDX24/MAK5
VSTLDLLCKALRFRTKNPKVIDLTEEDRMPESLHEMAVRCKVDEKDLYMYYFLKERKGESTIIFCNSITCTKRINNLLSFMKIKNYVLYSKMQQR